MLFKPQWDGPSAISMLLFCESKPADEAYPFMNTCRCACGQYSHSIGMTEDWWWRTFDDNMPMWKKLNLIARERPWTFGALAARLRQEIVKVTPLKPELTNG